MSNIAGERRFLAAALAMDGTGKYTSIRGEIAMLLTTSIWGLTADRRLTAAGSSAQLHPEMPEKMND